MVGLEISKQSGTNSSISELVKYLDKGGSSTSNLWINTKDKDNDLIVTVEWRNDSYIPKAHLLSYKVAGLKDLIGSFLGDSITTKLGDILLDYPNTGNLITLLGGYTQKTDLDTKLSDYTKTAKLDAKLSDYINTAKLDAKLGNYTKTAKLDAKLSDYINTVKLDAKLGNYTKTTDLKTQLGGYTKKTDLDTKLNDYIKTTDLNTKLSDYTRTDGSNMTDDISNKLMSHHTTQVFDFLSSLEMEYNAMHG
jgi:hypothetical protein